MNFVFFWGGKLSEQKGGNFSERYSISIYDSQNLRSLSGNNEDYIINEKQVFQWYCDLTQKSKEINPSFDFIKCFDDCCICFDEVIYFTAHLFLYRPYINNPLNDAITINGKTIYPNHQNFASKRYCMYMNVVYEKIYNFWDKVGDFIGANFPDKIRPKNVYFSEAIKVVNKCCSKTTYLNWLNQFLINDYGTLNYVRQKTVHYSGVDTEYRWVYIKNFTDRTELLRLHSEHIAVPEKIKLQIDNMRNGFYNTLCVIENYLNGYCKHK